MPTHHLKIQRQPFADLVSGRKTSEVRNCADREFREGDQVELFLIDETGNPANKSIVRTITHIQRGYGLPDDICVLSYATPVVERQQPVMKLEAKRLVGVDGEYGVSFVKAGWLDECRKAGGTFQIYTSPPAPVWVELPPRKPLQASAPYYEMRARLECRNNGYNLALDDVERIFNTQKIFTQPRKS